MHIIGVGTVGAQGARAPPNFLECHATLRKIGSNACATPPVAFIDAEIYT